MAAHPEADGEDGLEVVVLHLAGNFPAALVLNYSITSNSCLRCEFPFGKNGLQVVVHRAHADLEKVGHQFLSQPDRLILKPHWMPEGAGLVAALVPKRRSRRPCRRV